MRCSASSLACVLLLLASCAKEQSVAVELRRDGEQLLRCESASVSELTPTPGGWAYKCEGGGSIYVIYETDEGPAKGTVERVDVKTAGGESSSFVARSAGAEQCAAIEPSAAGPSALKDPHKGSYTIGMADPCAKLELVIE